MNILIDLAAIASKTVAKSYKHAAIPLNQTKLKLNFWLNFYQKFNKL